MRFHIPSFFVGVAVGAGGVALAPRLRPIAVEIASDAYRAIDALMLRLARGRENVQDLLAEARARAKKLAKRRHLREVA
jgi:hypothetical protein